jgi:hypothetical protein
LLLSLLAAAVLPGSLPAAAQRGPASDPFCTAPSAQIMIVGSYHFSNPGLDAKNVNADDVLAPRRQAEIEALVERLARFRPTKVMVEAPYGDPYVKRSYGRYLAGQGQLTHDETEQIGFRLARRMNLPTVHPIDFPMRMNGLRPDEVDDSWRPKQSAATNPSPSAGKTELTEEDRLLRASTMIEIFRRMNDPAKVEADHSANYLPHLLPEDSGAIYARSDLLANWYKRNFRMFANVARGTVPGDRVLVLVGSGHLKTLRDLAVQAPYFCLVETNAYLGK